MPSLKAFLSIAALTMLIQPAWAVNDNATGGAPTGAPVATPAPAAPGTCTKAAKPALSKEERARRKALRAERAAMGIQPPQRTPAQIAARRARAGC